MQKPQPVSENHRMHLKLTLLNATKSATIGILIVIVPCLFLFGIVLKYMLHFDLPSFTALEEWMARMDRQPLAKFLVPAVLIGAPIVGLAINLLAILHFEQRKEVKELVVTVKLKWTNIIVSLVCAAILFCFFLYAVGGNF